MTGEDLYQKLKAMTNEERKREIIVEDYSGCTAQFMTLRDVSLEEKRIDLVNDPFQILGKDYIAIRAIANYFLG
jgi:hypothetical protein